MIREGKEVEENILSPKQDTDRKTDWERDWEFARYKPQRAVRQKEAEIEEMRRNRVRRRNSFIRREKRSNRQEAYDLIPEGFYFFFDLFRLESVGRRDQSKDLFSACGFGCGFRGDALTQKIKLNILIASVCCVVLHAFWLCAALRDTCIFYAVVKTPNNVQYMKFIFKPITFANIE